MSRPAPLAIALLLVPAMGCIEGELDRKSILNRWRVLAIQADHPEARPGMDVHLDPLVVSPDGERAVHGEEGVAFAWVACVRAEEAPGLGGTQYDPEEPSEACGAAEFQMDLPTEADGSTTVPGAVTALLWPDPGELSEAAQILFGEEVTPEQIEELLSTIGLQVTMQLRILDEGEEVSVAFKRITLVDREELGTNPPPPRYDIGDATVSARDVDEPWLCVPEVGTTPVLPPDTEIVLSPDPDDEAWRETYYVLDITGAITAARERPYYAWLSTGGRFDQEVTRAPVREEIWRTPEEPGAYPLWFVVRDGHGGMSACRTEVEVR